MRKTGLGGRVQQAAGGELQVDVELDPGTIVGDMSYEPEQRLPAVVLPKRASYDVRGLLPFGPLHPIAISEVLRGLELLAVVKG